jgi:sulfhydrogenase subunit beta (sulfur reductase)
MKALTVGDRVVLEREGFDALFPALKRRGYRIVGPTLRDGAIVYGELSGAGDLPAGWADEQEPGRYQLRARGDGALFGYTVGPHSWKQFLHPARRLLSRQRKDGTAVPGSNDDSSRDAFVGVRACELEAMAVQDRVFLQGPFVERRYGGRRESAFVVAVQCGQAGGTCFCASLGCGPRAEAGFDLALTELLVAGRHAFLLEVGSERGAELVPELPCRDATPADLESAQAAWARAAGQMGRALEKDGLRDLLYGSYEHPEWEQVARRCLSCGNCTLVCPTCFCTTVEDAADLAGQEATRTRLWDTCFSLDFSYIHGGSVRTSVAARYRQWLTHKLAAWQDQFDTLGCVGCGRCITWCPAGIDITEEVQALRQPRPGEGEGHVHRDL